MTKVFIGGSRRVTRLNAEVRRRLDRMIEKRLPVLIGDANGADKAVQSYLSSRGYNRVQVFCIKGDCRNNLGSWMTREVPAPNDKKDFSYYAAKDEIMAREASIGFMIWDGRSVGTLLNIHRLVKQRKRVVVYLVPSKEFVTLRNKSDWETFLAHCGKEVQQRIEWYERMDARQAHNVRQVSLF